MNTSTEHRKSKRFEHKATVMIEDEAGGYICYGQMVNYSSGGMCIGSDTIYNMETPINIRFAKALYKAAPKTYHGKVRWCKELARGDFEYYYSLGVKYD